MVEGSVQDGADGMTGYGCSSRVVVVEGAARPSSKARVATVPSAPQSLAVRYEPVVLRRGGAAPTSREGLDDVVPEALAGAAGGTGRAVNVSCCVVTPEAVATCAEVASVLPGHQATNEPSAAVACTMLLSDRTSVTAVAPAATCPCTNVYGCPPLVLRCDCVAWLIGPELEPPSPITDTEDGGVAVAEVGGAAVAEPALNTCWDPPLPWAFAATVVNEGPLKHVALALPLCRIMVVNGPRVSVSTGCQLPAGMLDCGPSAALASCAVHCCCAPDVSPLAGCVGVAVQPANAGEAPALSPTSATIAPPVATSPALAPSATLGRRALERGR